MSNLIHDESAWTGTQEITEQLKTINFPTEGKYLDKNIALVINIPGINIGNNSSFYINDGIATWNWNVDASGNVTID